MCSKYDDYFISELGYEKCTTSENSKEGFKLLINSNLFRKIFNYNFQINIANDFQSNVCYCFDYFITNNDLINIIDEQEYSGYLKIYFYNLKIDNKFLYIDLTDHFYNMKLWKYEYITYNDFATLRVFNEEDMIAIFYNEFNYIKIYNLNIYNNPLKL